MDSSHSREITAADVLAEHQPDDYGFTCGGCAWTPPHPAVTGVEDFATHQMQALHAAGFTVVRNPQ